MDCSNELGRYAGQYHGLCRLGMENEGAFGALGTFWEEL